MQVSTADVGSDTCAASNYHRAMKAHGGRSELMRIPPSLQTCFCVGNQTGDPAAAGSPVAQYCPEFRGGGPGPGSGVGGGVGVGVGVGASGTGPSARYARHPPDAEGTGGPECKMHALGFADAVEPITAFLVAAAYGSI